MQALRIELKNEIRETVAALRAHFDDRMDADNETRDRMHMQSQALAIRIENQAMITNGRVTTLEALFKNIEKEFLRIRDKWHSFRASVQTMIERKAMPLPAGATGENRQITMRDVYVFVGGAGVMIALGKMLKFY